MLKQVFIMFIILSTRSINLTQTHANMIKCIIIQLLCSMDFHWVFYAPATKSWGHINLPPVRPFVRPFVRPSGYRYMVYPAISSYSFGATALIFCRMFIHIMEVCMSTWFWWSDGGIICVLQTHFIFKKNHS